MRGVELIHRRTSLATIAGGREDASPHSPELWRGRHRNCSWLASRPSAFASRPSSPASSRSSLVSRLMPGRPARCCLRSQTSRGLPGERPAGLRPVSGVCLCVCVCVCVCIVDLPRAVTPASGCRLLDQRHSRAPSAERRAPSPSRAGLTGPPSGLRTGLQTGVDPDGGTQRGDSP